MHAYRVTLAYRPFIGEHFSRTSSFECFASSHEQAECYAAERTPLAFSMAHTVAIEQIEEGR